MREPRWVMESAKAKALAARERSELRGVYCRAAKKFITRPNKSDTT